MAEPPQLASVLQALAVAHDWTADAAAKRAATDYCEQVKGGEVHLMVQLGLALVSAGRRAEFRHFGFNILQHCVRHRWDQLSGEERQQLAGLFVELLRSGLSPEDAWPLKSGAAALVAEVVRREGGAAWGVMLQPLLENASAAPLQAELAAMVVQQLPEDVTVHNDDLAGPRKRELLQALTASLPVVLPFLYRLLDVHFAAALGSVQQGDVTGGRQHAEVVSAALKAVSAYGDWAPVLALSSSGLLEACGFLLHAAEFRLAAADVLLQVAVRRRPSDDTAPSHDSALRKVFEALSACAQGTLQRLSAGGDSADEAELGFAERLCEALVGLGSHNLTHALGGEPARLEAFLQEMLAFLQQKRLRLVARVLPLWLVLLRESAAVSNQAVASPLEAKPSALVAGGFSVKARHGGALAVSPNYCAAVLEAVAERLPKRVAGAGALTAHGGFESSEEEGWPEEFDSAQEFGQYRSQLVEAVRLISVQQPLLAVQIGARRIEAAVTAGSQAVGGPQVPLVAAALLLESTHLLLASILVAVPEPLMAAAATGSGASELSSLLEGLLSRLLSVQWSEPGLVHQLSRHFEAFGPYLKFGPALLRAVMERLFELVTVVPKAQEGEHAAERERNSARSAAASATREPNWAARLQVCTAVMRVARSADSALVPHMAAVAEAMSGLRQQGHLLQSEYNLLAEALLSIGAAAEPEAQRQVVEWLLGPLQAPWSSPTLQRQVAEPAALVALLVTERSAGAESQADGAGTAQEGADWWWIYHTVALFERTLRRSTPMGGVGSESPAPSQPHPVGPHLHWMLPPLLALLRSLHALWEPSVRQRLPPDLAASLDMGPMERAALLGEPGRAGAEGGQPGRRSVAMQRNWLKGLRESAYNILGFTAVRVDAFWKESGRAQALAAALLKDLPAMEQRHLRLLLRTVVAPIVRACPARGREVWLGCLLPPLLVHCHCVLVQAWQALLDPEREASGATAAEVLEEKLLRDLTREATSLLAAFACPQPTKESQTPTGGPSMEREGSSGSGLLAWVLAHEGAGAAAVRLALEALRWPDSEAAHKALTFCTATAQLAPADRRLHQVVGEEMFRAALWALTLESNAAAQSEVLGLIRDIYMHLAPLTPAPRQVLLQLPAVSEWRVAAFEAALAQTGSGREQRAHVKHLLLGAGGDQLRALQPTKATTTIINVTDRVGAREEERRRLTANKSLEHTDGSIGLASLS